MAKTTGEDDAPFFIGGPEQLQAFARWIDEFERAAISRVASEQDEFSSVLDLKAMNKALAVAGESLDCLNLLDAKKCCLLVGELQRDVAAILAGGLEAALRSPEGLQEQDIELRCVIQEATPYIRWLGVRVRDELATYARTDRGSDKPGVGGPKEAKPKRPGRKKADYETVQHEAKLAADWARALGNGVYKADFAKEQGMTPKDFGRLLSRVRKRDTARNNSRGK